VYMHLLTGTYVQASSVNINDPQIVPVFPLGPSRASRIRPFLAPPTRRPAPMRIHPHRRPPLTFYFYMPLRY
jgi:hypothetical protein